MISIRNFPNPLRIAVVILFLIVGAIPAFAQTPTFTYQGKLQQSGAPANGSYDFQFKVFDAVTGGTQQPEAGGACTGPKTVEIPGVQVTNGTFSVQLNFEMAGCRDVFSGADRYLEISVRGGSVHVYATLSPRQQIISTPYAVRSLSAGSADTATNATNATSATNALQLGGVAATQYVLSDDPRLSDARTPLLGSSHYIQSGTNLQAGSFNISGNAQAGTFAGNAISSQTHYYFGTNRVLSIAGVSNTLLGIGTGPLNTGQRNSFFGDEAGAGNTTGGDNSFTGYRSGSGNTTGASNSFFGSGAGSSNESASAGGSNSFFGFRSGEYSTGNHNTFVGDWAGGGTNVPGFTLINTGHENTFVGSRAGRDNGAGSLNTVVGALTQLANDLTQATAIGAKAVVVSSHTIVLGTSAENVVVPGTFQLGAFPIAGVNQACWNASDQLSTCSSSLRYKKNVARFVGGMNIINRLSPIAFSWKEGGMRDIGLGAEEVNQVEPMLTFHNQKNEIEGVRYNQLAPIFINAFKEQQAQITQQQQLLAKQQALIERHQQQFRAQQQQLRSLRSLVCSSHRRARVCK